MLFMLTRLLRFFLGGFLSCWLPASSAMSGLTLSIHLGYPSAIPGSGDGVRKAYFVNYLKLLICTNLVFLQVSSTVNWRKRFLFFKVVILLLTI